jgi:hypothetical protein
MILTQLQGAEMICGTALFSKDFTEVIDME